MAPKASSSMTVKQLQAALKKKKIDFDKKAKKAELVELLEASVRRVAVCSEPRSTSCALWRGNGGVDASGLASSAAPCDKKSYC